MPKGDNINTRVLRSFNRACSLLRTTYVTGPMASETTLPAGMNVTAFQDYLETQVGRHDKNQIEQGLLAIIRRIEGRAAQGAPQEKRRHHSRRGTPQLQNV